MINGNTNVLRENPLAKNYIIAVCTLIFSFFIFAAFFAHPYMDDFTYAIMGQKKDFLSTVLNERQIRNGRYISNFLLIGSPLNWGGLVAYRLMSVTLLFSFIIGFYFFFKNLVKERVLLLTSVCSVITLSILPDVTEAFYWYSGAWTYTTGLLLLITGIGLEIHLNNKISLLPLILVGTIFFIASGFHELISVLGALFYLTSFILTKNKRKLYLAFLFSLCFIYIYLAPGNEARSDLFRNNHNLFDTLYLSTLYTGRFVLEWLINPALIIWVIIISNLKWSKNISTHFKSLRSPSITALIIIAPTFICCAAPIWSTGMLGQYRTPNMAAMFFVISITLIAIANQDKIKKRTSKLNHSFATLLFVLSLVVWKNNFYIIKDTFSGNIIAFNEKMKERYIKLEECSKHSEQNCLLERVETDCSTLVAYPLKDDPEEWNNKSYQLYFNTGQILLKDE